MRGKGQPRSSVVLLQVDVDTWQNLTLPAVSELSFGERVPMVEYRVKGPPEWRPNHLGELLREDVVPALRLTVKAAAEKLGPQAR